MDPYALNPVQETGMSGVSGIYAQPEGKDTAPADSGEVAPGSSLGYLMSPTLTNKMGQLNLCTPQMKITAFPNPASLQ